MAEQEHRLVRQAHMREKVSDAALQYAVMLVEKGAYPLEEALLLACGVEAHYRNGNFKDAKQFLQVMSTFRTD